MAIYSYIKARNHEWLIHYKLLDQNRIANIVISLLTFKKDSVSSEPSQKGIVASFVNSSRISRRIAFYNLDSDWIKKLQKLCEFFLRALLGILAL